MKAVIVTTASVARSRLQMTIVTFGLCLWMGGGPSWRVPITALVTWTRVVVFVVALVAVVMHLGNAV